MVLGTTTAVSTRAAGAAPGALPLPPSPAMRGWAGMTYVSSGTAMRALTGIISRGARVACPAKIWMPWMRTVR